MKETQRGEKTNFREISWRGERNEAKTTCQLLLLLTSIIDFNHSLSCFKPIRLVAWRRVKAVPLPARWPSLAIFWVHVYFHIDSLANV